MRGALLGSLLVAMAFAGCSSSTGDDQNGAGGGVDAGGLIFPGSGADGGLGSGRGANCVSDSVATEAAPLDIYVMFDQSCSMSCPPDLAGPGRCCTGGPNPRIDQ